MNFKVSKEIFEKFPDVVEYIVVGTGLNNEVSSKEINDLLDGVSNAVKGKSELLNDLKYSKWVDVYNNIKPGFEPSHVALAKRVIDGKKIPHINPVVNLCNYYSLKYMIPTGGEDMSKVYGDLELKFSDGSELFLGIGDRKIEKIGKGEVIWMDDHSVTCRMWAWRQSERTKLTKNSKNVYFIIDSFSEFEIENIVENFSKDLKKYFGGEFQILKISKDNPVATVQYKSMVLKTGGDTNRDLEQLIGTGISDEKKSRGNLFQRRAKSLGLVDENLVTYRLSKMADRVLSNIGVSESSDVQLSQNLKFGDYSSTVVLRESKKTGRSVKDTGQMILNSLRGDERLKNIFSEISLADNGFLNFFMSESFLISELLRSVKKNENFGCLDVGNGKTIVIESPSINPNAPAHIGHLRNLLIGRSLARLLENVGFKVEKDNLINDKDNKVCMAMWGYQEYGEGKTPESENMKPDHFVGKYYVIGRREYKENPSAKAEIDDMLKKLEEGDSKITKLWRQVTNWAFTGQLQTFERLNEERGFLWYESDLWKGGKRLIEKYLNKGVVEKLPDGAVVGRIEEKYGVPDVILLRKDGTSLYHTQDLNLTIQKIEKFKPWKAIWVLGNEHMLHFQRLFALIDALGILDIDNLFAYLYGMVLGKNGKKISSREGGDASADQILDMAHDAALKVLETRDIDSDRKREIAEKVGQAAIRYEILSKDAFKDIILDIEKSVSFTGKSGSYVMYAYTRAKNILNKVGSVEFSEIGDVKIGQDERNLLLRLLSYPEVALNAANNYLPSIIAEYAYSVASEFNNFYEKCSVSEAEGDTKAFRTALTVLSANVLKSSLGILGIEVIDEM